MTVAQGNQVRRELMLGCYVFVLWQVIEDLAERLRQEMELIAETKLALGPTTMSDVTSSKRAGWENFLTRGRSFSSGSTGDGYGKLRRRLLTSMLNLRQRWPKVASCGRRIGCLEASSRSCTRGCRLFEVEDSKAKTIRWSAEFQRNWDMDKKRKKRHM